MHPVYKEPEQEPEPVPDEPERSSHDTITRVRQGGDDPPFELPPLRTFRVTVERRRALGGKEWTLYEDLLILAHGYNQEGDAAQFFQQTFERCTDPNCGEWHLPQYCRRTLRPVVDVEEVFDQTETVQ